MVFWACVEGTCVQVLWVVKIWCFCELICKDERLATDWSSWWENFDMWASVVFDLWFLGFENILKKLDRKMSSTGSTTNASKVFLLSLLHLGVVFSLWKLKAFCITVGNFFFCVWMLKKMYVMKIKEASWMYYDNKRVKEEGEEFWDVNEYFANFVNLE